MKIIQISEDDKHYLLENEKKIKNIGKALSMQGQKVKSTPERLVIFTVALTRSLLPYLSRQVTCEYWPTLSGKFARRRNVFAVMLYSFSK